MKRTRRTLVILTVAFWLAALTPAPAFAGRDPVRIGVGVGGEVIDLVNPADHDEDEGDEDNGDEDNGDENGDGLVEVVERILDVLFGEDEDSVHMAAAGPVFLIATPSPADDDGGLVGELVEALEEDDGLGDSLEEVVDEVTEPVEIVLCLVDRETNQSPPPPTWSPCA